MLFIYSHIVEKQLDGPKNTLNTTLNKMNRLHEMTTISVLIIIMILVCVSFDVSWQDLKRPIFLEFIFGLPQSILPTLNRLIFVMRLFCGSFVIL